ncbi:hypothetical protein FACS1894191_2570 [Clostridia bacterium]|nr:hypothetical protein FACS1894191_2570 [Clostridia bacterium]
MIDEETLDGMMKLDGDGLFEKVNELEETMEKYTIDKLYDGLLGFYHKAVEKNAHIIFSVF